MESTETRSTLLSRISIIFSSICVVHCMVHPIMIMLLPFVSEFFDGTVQVTIVLMIIPISLLGFLPTWLKHRNRKLMQIFLIGLITLVAAQLLIPDEGLIYLMRGISVKNFYFNALFTFIGAGMLAWSTYKNNHHTHVCHNPEHQQVSQDHRRVTSDNQAY
jgi:hypothetical protein